MIGDGSYLLMVQGMVTSVQENYRLIIMVLIDHGFSCIGNISDLMGAWGVGSAENA